MPKPYGEPSSQFEILDPLESRNYFTSATRDYRVTYSFRVVKFVLC